MPLLNDFLKIDKALKKANNMLSRSKENTLKSVNYSHKPARSQLKNEPTVYNVVKDAH